MPIATNEHTGDKIQTRVPNEAFKNNYDNIDWSKPLYDSPAKSTGHDTADGLVPPISGVEEETDNIL